MMTSNILYTDRFRHLTSSQLVEAKGLLVAAFDDSATKVVALGALIRSGANGTAKMKRELGKVVAAKVEAETAILAIDALLFGKA